MKLNFNTELYLKQRKKNNLCKDDIKGTFPVFIFYAKEDKSNNSFEVLHFDWRMSSLVRSQDKEESKKIIERYNPAWVIKNMLSEKTITETTHLITGYYDLINDEWVQLESEIVDFIDHTNISNIMIETNIKSSKIFFNSKELYLHNLSVIAKDYNLSFLLNKDLQSKLDMSILINYLITWFQDNKNEIKSASIDSNNNFIAPIELIFNYLNSHDVNKVDDKGVSNLWNLFGIMRAHDLFQFGLYQKNKNTFYNEKEIHLIDLENIDKDNFIQVPMFNERFTNIFLK